MSADIEQAAEAVNGRFIRRDVPNRSAALPSLLIKYYNRYNFEQGLSDIVSSRIIKKIWSTVGDSNTVVRLPTTTTP